MLPKRKHLQVLALRGLKQSEILRDALRASLESLEHTMCDVGNSPNPIFAGDDIVLLIENSRKTQERYINMRGDERPPEGVHIGVAN